MPPTNTDGTRTEVLPRTALVVDDVEGIRHLYRSVLDEASRLEVVGEAADGRQAVQAVEQLEPDLVLLDISMPEMDGLEALEQIKEARPATEVVIVSALLEARAGDRARELGAAGYLEKEGDPATLVRRLEAALGLEGQLRADDGEEASAEVYAESATEDQVVGEALSASRWTLEGVAEDLAALRDRIDGAAPDAARMLEDASRDLLRAHATLEGLEAVRGPSEPDAVRLEGAVEEALTRLAACLADPSRVRYEHLGSVEGDRDELVALLEGVLARALDAAGAAGEVRVEAEQDGGTVELTVAPVDGAPEADAGPDLAVCRRIAERQGGELGADGAALTVRLARA